MCREDVKAAAAATTPIALERLWIRREVSTTYLDKGT